MHYIQLLFTKLNSFSFLGPSSNNNPVTTKILYFTNRSVTPFMSTMSRKIGEITLRDFKVLFDRPGFYRFHFKSVDQEFGMVKEEVRSQLYNCILGNVLKFYFSDFLWWHGFARIWWQNCSMGRRRLKCFKNQTVLSTIKLKNGIMMVHNINYIL